MGGNLISGALASAFGWEIVFYVIGALLMVWFCFWSFLCFNEPAVHPRITKVVHRRIITFGDSNHDFPTKK